MMYGADDVDVVDAVVVDVVVDEEGDEGAPLHLKSNNPWECY